MPTIDAVVAKYVELRDETKVISDRHAAELAPYSESMKKIEVWLMAKLDADGADNYKTPHGTAYRAVSTSVTTADKLAFLEFMVTPQMERIDNFFEKQHDHKLTSYELLVIKVAIDELLSSSLLDVRPGKKGIQEYVEERGEVPPGLNVTRVATVNIRRS